jgi:large subunit ribosomal protein L28
MPRQCDICGKGYIKGHNVSKSNNRTIRRWEPNLQKVRALAGKAVKHLRVCTRCIKKGRVQKAA